MTDNAAPPADHPGRASHLNNLRIVLEAQYERTGDTTVLADAVKAGRDAVAATPSGHPHRARHLSNLSVALEEMSQSTGDTAMLGEAVQAGRQAVAATPERLSLRQWQPPVPTSKRTSPLSQ